MFNLRLIILGYGILISLSVMAIEADPHFDHQEVPNDVRVVTRLVGRLDWGYDSYYEIDLEVKGQVIASTTSIPEQTREKREAMIAIINQAREEGKFVEINLSNFSQAPQEALSVSSRALPQTQDSSQEQPVCNRPPKQNWFLKWIGSYNDR